MDISLAYAERYFGHFQRFPLAEEQRAILTAAKDIRDRLTHPATHADYSVTAEERRLITGVFTWFAGAVLSTMGHAHDLKWETCLNGLRGQVPKGKRALRYLAALDEKNEKSWLVHYKLLSEVLISDSIKCHQLLLEVSSEILSKGVLEPEEENNFTILNRIMMRSFIAGVNGVCAALNRFTIWAHEAGRIKLDLPYVFLLREERYFLQRQRIRVGDSFNDLTTNFSLAFEFFPVVHGVEYRLDKNTEGWRHFRETLKLRNAVTHPRSLSHFLLPLDWVKMLNEATQWFIRQVADLEENLAEQVDCEA
jgi:hypothetical protein